MTKTIKEKDVEDQFSSWQGWECKTCGVLIASDYGNLVEHLSTHEIEVEEN